MGALSIAGFAQVFDALAQDAGPGPVSMEDLVPVFLNIKAGFLVVGDALEAADSQANLAVTAATDAATEAEAVGQDVNDITRHTYTVVIPHSLSWLAGYVVTTWIDPIRKDITTLDNKIKFLDGWRGQIDSWRKTWVDPELKDWHGFHVWFKGWPLKLMNQWHTWMEHPAEFGSFWAPYLVRPIVAWLGSQQHTQERDVLSLMMVQAWGNDVNLTWDAVLDWVVSDK